MPIELGMKSVVMHVCIISTLSAESTSIDQPGMVANPALGQLNREKCFFSLSPFAREKLVSRDRFGRPVPRQPAYSPHSG